MFFRSGDGLPEPLALPPAYTRYGSPVAHGRREGELSYSPEDDSIYSGSPSLGSDRGPGTRGGGILGRGMELVERVGSEFLNRTNDFLDGPQTPPPVLIAVMGKTGTGKTSFVNAITGGELLVGGRLKSCEYSFSTNFPSIYLRGPLLMRP